jgi:CxxC motif-containing protein (DUF1111 family)
MDSGWFDKVYEDDDCTVLHIRDAKGEPPKEETDDTSTDDTDAQSPEQDSDEEPQP